MFNPFRPEFFRPRLVKQHAGSIEVDSQRLGVVDRQLQLRHEPPHFDHRLRRLEMILTPPESVRKLQTALQAKAKGAPNYRFYLLYDKLYRKDVLAYAYQRCKANKGTPGIDEQEFADIEAYGKNGGSTNWRRHSAGRR